MLCNLKVSESVGLFKSSSFLCMIAYERPSKYFNSYSLKLGSSLPYTISYHYLNKCALSDGNALCNKVVQLPETNKRSLHIGGLSLT